MYPWLLSCPDAYDLPILGIHHRVTLGVLERNGGHDHVTDGKLWELDGKTQGSIEMSGGWLLSDNLLYAWFWKSYYAVYLQIVSEWLQKVFSLVLPWKIIFYLLTPSNVCASLWLKYCTKNSVQLSQFRGSLRVGMVRVRLSAGVDFSDDVLGTAGFIPFLYPLSLFSFRTIIPGLIYDLPTSPRTQYCWTFLVRPWNHSASVPRSDQTPPASPWLRAYSQDRFPGWRTCLLSFETEFRELQHRSLDRWYRRTPVKKVRGCWPRIQDVNGVNVSIIGLEMFVEIVEMFVSKYFLENLFTLTVGTKYVFHFGLSYESIF